MLRFVQNDRVLFWSHGLKIRAIGELMWDVIRDASYEVRVFLSLRSRRIGEIIVFLSARKNIGDVLGSAQFFFNIYFFFLKISTCTAVYCLAPPLAGLVSICNCTSPSVAGEYSSSVSVCSAGE